MDTVTHALAGAAISDCWFRKRLGPVATPFALAVAALPDADVVTRLVSRESFLLHHRGITHSFLAILLAAPLLGLAGRALAKRGGWKEWGALALLCLLSHTVLDLLTSWGTMPLLPFSNARLAWDVLPIIDLFLLGVTGASFVLNRLLRRERVDSFVNPLVYPVVHRHPGRRKVGDWAARIALALAFLYILVGAQQNRQTVRLAAEALRRSGVEAAEVRALPIFLTYIAYEITAREADGTVHSALYSSFAPEEICFRAHPPGGTGPLRAFGPRNLRDGLPVLWRLTWNGPEEGGEGDGTRD